MTITRFMLAGSITALFIMAGCAPTVEMNNNSDLPIEGGCTQPAPPANGSCPPVWECQNGQWVDMAGRCNTQCPAERPLDGSPCDQPALDVCSYEVVEQEPCDDGTWTYHVEMMCTAEGWATTSNYCQPEPICPNEPPVTGTSCGSYPDAYYCDYGLETACGAVSLFSYCQYVEGEWLWDGELHEGCESCVDLDSEVACSADPNCSWNADESNCY
jgi:hypothetical protein